MTLLEPDTPFRNSRHPPEGAPGPTPFPTEIGRGLVCELCGFPAVERHCKIVCLNCGYQRDCSDP